MKKILIADSDKSSLLFTSESLKSCLHQPYIAHTKTGGECLDLSRTNNFDLIIVDFDLPDCDGVMLSKELKKTFKGPIFITSYDNTVIEKAIDIELFPYKDLQRWIKKPLRVKSIKENLDAFLIKKIKPIKIFSTQQAVHAYLPGKSRKPLDINLLQLSIEHALVKSKDLSHLNKGEFFSLVTTADIKKQKKQNSINCQVNWRNKRTNYLHLSFPDLTQQSQDIIIDIMRISKEISI